MPLPAGPAERSPDESLDPVPEELQQVLSIDQIRAIRATNDYVERPASVKPAPLGLALPHAVAKAAAATQERPPASAFQDFPPPVPVALSHSSTASSLSHSTTASEQRLLGALTPSHSGQSLVRTQPCPGDRKPEEAPKGSPGKPPGAHAGHLFVCEECGHCKCARCAAARSLPSCWLCNQRCLCSPENLLDYGTCLCCVKALFYHCSSDDEDTCADDPCACGPGACCVRWSAMGALSLLLPCLCCYFPTLGCLKLCQRGYDAARRPGCRCRSHTNTVCRKVSVPGGPAATAAAAAAAAAVPKTVDKPV